MQVGKILLIYDNDSYMLGEETKTVSDPQLRHYMDWRFYINGELHPATCKVCGRVIDDNYLNPKFKLRKKKLALSITYDGFYIASDHFKEYIEKKRFNKITFRTLPSVNGFYQLAVNNVLQFDISNPYMQLEDYCDSCQSYSTIVSAAKVLKDLDKPLDRGLYRTDIKFGTSHEQAPLLIADTQTAEEINRNFKNIDFMRLGSSIK